MTRPLPVSATYFPFRRRWAVVDTGIGNNITKKIWEELLSGPLAGRPLTRLIVTHMHPDHVGAAGWLSRLVWASQRMCDVIRSLVNGGEPAHGGTIQTDGDS